MCLFPKFNYNSLKIKKSSLDLDRPSLIPDKFDCGYCPECLKKRANRIALRDYFEAKDHLQNCMVTLTYDQYIRDDKGNIIGEELPARDKRVNVRDCQLFIKRLRQHVKRHYGAEFKYRISAEYGKRTHRPHYHVLLFGFCFRDCVPLKKSKRGNTIYYSAELVKLWRNGVCSVDAQRITPAIAAYCSKYTQKDHGAEDTFSLCSRGIGAAALWREFNGLYYMMEGTKYPIPREIWQKYIIEKYKGLPIAKTFSPRYVNRSKYALDVRQRVDSDGVVWEERFDCAYERAKYLRERYRFLRNSDEKYQKYLAYWQARGEEFEKLQPSVIDRILQLDDSKYHFYKAQAIRALYLQKCGVPYPAPRSSSQKSFVKYLYKRYKIRFAPNERTTAFLSEEFEKSFAR